MHLIVEMKDLIVEMKDLIVEMKDLIVEMKFFAIWNFNSNISKVGMLPYQPAEKSIIVCSAFFHLLCKFKNYTLNSILPI